MILLVTEVEEYKANPNRKALGTVIEAQLDKGRGSVATFTCSKWYIESWRSNCCWEYIWSCSCNGE